MHEIIKTIAQYVAYVSEGVAALIIIFYLKGMNDEGFNKRCQGKKTFTQ